MKKPRSVSESESSCTSPEAAGAVTTKGDATNSSVEKNRYSFSDGGGTPESGLERMSSSECSSSGLKKSVSFSKQVVRNIFKPGSTISGMKKPGSNKNKNKKKQQRKRTLSDPSCDQVDTSAAESNDGGESKSQAALSFRARSVSESSSDDAGFLLSSIRAAVEKSQEAAAAAAGNNTNCKKNNKKKKKNNNNNTTNVNTKLDQIAGNQDKNKCNIQLKNKIATLLDD